jgi:FkbM family methyltransferase
MKFIRLKATLKALISEDMLHILRGLRFKARFGVLFRIKNRKGMQKHRDLILNKFPTLQRKNQKGIAIDLGANIGDFSAACLNLGFHVISIEPHPIANSYLQKRFKNKSKLQIINAAIGNMNGESQLNYHSDHLKDPITTSISASTIEDKFPSNIETKTVQMLSLESVIQEREISLLKCDIEGAEYLIIDSILLNGSRIERLLMETHERFMTHSKHAQEYERQLNKLQTYIKVNHLEQRWFVDWI